MTVTSLSSLSSDSVPNWPVLDAAFVREALLAKTEIALLDVREEDPYAKGHPLWAANLPLSTLELNAWRRIPRRSTLIVLYGTQDQAEAETETDTAPIAAERLRSLGYTNIHLLKDGLQGWRDAGYELFIDVNVPSKSFGEWVESKHHTPSLPAQVVKKLIEQKDGKTVVVDARRFDEYQTMSIPSATSVPGAELVLRVRELAPDPDTRIIVNCAGRTRSIIGTQSLINAGLPNPIAALRNGTIGWLLADQKLDHGASRRYPESVKQETLTQAQSDARSVAQRAGVQTIDFQQLTSLEAEDRTLYKLDVRAPEEYEQGHLPGFLNAPGGQLVQETDHHAPVHGARIVLADSDGVRANMSASWLAQMGWDVYVVENVPSSAFTETKAPALHPADPQIPAISPSELQNLLTTAQAQDSSSDIALLDFTVSARYVARHIPGAWYVNRALLRAALQHIPQPKRYVLTCGSSQLARWAAVDLAKLLKERGDGDILIHVLQGGTQAWIDQNLRLEHGETRLASPRVDRYRRPYEGTDSPAQAMQDYLDWEYGLVEQLNRDGTHGFQVI